MNNEFNIDDYYAGAEHFQDLSDDEQNEFVDYGTLDYIDQLHNSSYKRDYPLILPKTPEEAQSLITELKKWQICDVRDKGDVRTMSYVRFYKSMKGILY